MKSWYKYYKRRYKWLLCWCRGLSLLQSFFARKLSYSIPRAVAIDCWILATPKSELLSLPGFTLEANAVAIENCNREEECPIFWSELVGATWISFVIPSFFLCSMPVERLFVSLSLIWALPLKRAQAGLEFDQHRCDQCSQVVHRVFDSEQLRR
jgi:hypothetical protein